MKVGQWIELFRAGDYGPKGEYTEEDISKMAENFEENDKVPIVIGHPKDNDPAWGWLDKMAAAGDILLARVGELHNDMFEAINYSGLFKNRSVRIADTGSGPKIMHLGMLGGTLPEVPGLAPLTFSSDNNTGHDFSEEMPQETVEEVPSQDSIPQADDEQESPTEIPLEEQETKAQQPEKAKKYNETPVEKGGNDKPSEENSMTPEEIAALQKEAQENKERAEAAEAKANEVEAENAKMKEQHQADMAASRRKGYEAMVKDFPNAVDEKDRTAFVEFCMAQPQGEEHDFSFDDGSGKKLIDPAKWFTDFVKAKDEQIKALKKDKPHMRIIGGDFSVEDEKKERSKPVVDLASTNKV